MEAFEGALPQLMKRARLSKNHQDVIVGEILNEYKGQDGTIYKTEIGDNAFNLVGNIWNDNEESRMARKQAQDGMLNCFSIRGNIQAGGVQIKKENGREYREISKMDLYAVTLCEKGQNPRAKFSIVKSQSSEPAPQESSMIQIKEEKLMTDEVKTPAPVPAPVPEVDRINGLEKTMTVKLDQIMACLKKEPDPAPAPPAPKTPPAPAEPECPHCGGKMKEGMSKEDYAKAYAKFCKMHKETSLSPDAYNPGGTETAKQHGPNSDVAKALTDKRSVATPDPNTLSKSDYVLTGLAKIASCKDYKERARLVKKLEQGAI
jgi:hypothetical protein